MRNGGSSIGPCNSTEDHLRVRAGLLVCGAALGAGATLAEAETKILTVGSSGNFQYRTINAAVAVAEADSNAQNITAKP